MQTLPRADEDEPFTGYVDPWNELNAGLWTLFAGTTFFLGLRIWVKITRRHGLWYDDYILIVCWCLLLANNALIVHQFNSGYVLKNPDEAWDDRMHILISISSCGTLIGQAWSKTAFAATLLRISNTWQRWVLWFCIGSMNIWMILKVIFQWAKVCDKPSYDVWYRLDFCINWKFRDNFKEGGNVWNIIMDFVFAAFPWLITRHLEMRRVEKIGLCLTMSLGIIVAVASAVRVSWKDKGNIRDAHYFWRNGMSQVWYSSEITGTIMVQCIPVLRTLVRDIHTSLTSRKLGSTGDNRSSAGWTIRRSWKRSSTTRAPSTIINKNNNDDVIVQNPDKMELKDIPEEPSDPSIHDDYLPSPSSGRNKYGNQTALYSDSWPFPDDGRGSLSIEQERVSSSTNYDLEQGDQGLSAPPRRRAY